MKLEQLFEQERKNVIADLKSKKKEKHRKEAKMKTPPQVNGYGVNREVAGDEAAGAFL